MKLARPVPLLHSLVLSCSLLFGCAATSAPAISAMDPEPEMSSPALRALSGNHEPPAESEVSDGPTVSASAPARKVSASHIAKNAVVKKENNGNVNGSSNGDDDQALLDTAMELTESAQEYWQDNDMDKAFESLDQAYALLLSVPTDPNNPKLNQQKEDTRFVISKRIMEMYASCQVAVKGSYNEIPMVMNDHVKREIQSFQTLERDFFIEAYRRSGRYRADMVKALKDAGMPEDISWLPLIESGFKSRAYSKARAFGLWQFIPSTGYKFGLKRNDWIDERLDPQKATAAAIAYMKELHAMFGDWATVLAAYNCGEGAVARVIRNQKSNYLDNFWDLYEQLPRETARYYPRFLATLAIVKDPAKYGFTLQELEKPQPYETVMIERPVHLKTLADKLDVSVEDLAMLNPELRRDATPNSAYALRVPVGKSAAVTACLETLPKWTPPRVEYVVHRVRRGENLSLIALRYRTTIDRIKQANNLHSGRMLRVGQKLKIPSRGSTMSNT